MKPRNDRALALSAFCLELEKYRRTDESRFRNADSFLQFYAPKALERASASKDTLFSHLPREVRGPILAGWRIRGAKAALRDDDKRVCDVVRDALEAGDLDASMFEAGITAEILIDHVPLDEWWTFWRGAALPNAAVQKGLAAARTHHLFDDTWFLESVEARGGKLRGTVALADTLTKDDVVGWIRGIHAAGDATAAGIIAARGWGNVLAKTAPDALQGVLDALARKHQLVAVVGANAVDEAANTPAEANPAVAEGTPAVVLETSRAEAGPESVPKEIPEAARVPMIGWDENSSPDFTPQSLPGEVVRDDEIETVTPHRPPPMLE